MNKTHWVMVVMLASGCALIDATSGPDAPIILDTETDHTTGETAAPLFQPRVCGWTSCECVTEGCDPSQDCAPTICGSCEADAHCAPNDRCTEFGVCAACNVDVAGLTSYVAADGTVYNCGVNSFGAVACFDTTCLPE